ncbi:MAG: ribosome small subunit-dependent GTPase A [Anaerolineaceae bacterium]|nr:ribosome small subunit-dependent GTPase A [Anaerolineaceae bacterium]
MPTAHAFEQIIVANIDQVVPVFAAADPTPKWNMLDRYLISAESSRLPSLIVITKLDLVSATKGDYQDDLKDVIEEYRRIGYRVIVTSTVTSQGLEELKDALHDRVTVFVGKSGVGKTSLLNALQPGLGLIVKEISKSTGKGRHTTSYLEMFPLENGGAIVDTPGVREFGPWNVYGDDLVYCFPEMRGYVGKCKFGLDCRHEKEPECVIREAVLKGEISQRRYKVYLGFRDETYLPSGHRDI